MPARTQLGESLRRSRKKAKKAKPKAKGKSLSKKKKAKPAKTKTKGKKGKPKATAKKSDAICKLWARHAIGRDAPKCRYGSACKFRHAFKGGEKRAWKRGASDDEDPDSGSD